MSYRQLIADMSPELYQRLKRAVELGKWPDGRPVSAAQRAHALQAVIAWDSLHVAPREQTGFIDSKHKKGQSCDGGSAAEQTLNWVGQEGGDER